MTTDLVQIDWSTLGGDMPFCTKCGRTVDSVECEYMIEVVSAHPHPQYGHTGEIVVTIECHGEKFKISNWRGVI